VIGWCTHGSRRRRGLHLFTPVKT